MAKQHASKGGVLFMKEKRYSSDGNCRAILLSY